MSEPEKPASGPEAGKPGDAPMSGGSGSRFGDAFFAVQKFVIGRAWSLLLLTILSQIGGMAIHKAWEDVSKSGGRVATMTALLVVGLIVFWIAPKRAGFMRRLCFLLVFGGISVVVLTWIVAVILGDAMALGHLKAVQDTWIGQLGLGWLASGIVLGVLMWGGRFVFRKWRQTPEAAAIRAGHRVKRAGDSAKK